MNGKDVFYQSLRALGPIPEAAVPDAIANQILASGMFQGDMSQCKATIALYASVAASSTLAEFASVLETGILPTGDPLNAEAHMMAAAGWSCCHTDSCEGSCTPSGR